jgi:NAD(P)-dependent dehydrogenase (short-subunit alcohol dehydrogenase family)
MTPTEQLFRLDGKVALVTGGYGGIGAAVCRGLVDMGASVAVAGHSADKAEAFAAKLRDEGANAFAAPFDALSVADTQRMADEVAKHFGRLDILVNAVGGNVSAERADAVTEEGFDRVLDLNLKSAMFQAQAAAKHMIAGGAGGKQMHLGSVRSLLGLRGQGFAAYCAAKAGLTVLCKQLAAEWAPHKINVNVLSPTFVRTEQGERFLSDPAFYKSVTDRIPAGRIGETTDVVGGTLFLVSPASDFITGQTIYLDGGLTAVQ